MANIFLITLGCPKNQVDSEIIAGIISREKKFQLVDDCYYADIVIINTCGFIQDAKEESIQTIFEAVQLKEKGIIKGIIVSGCLTQRYPEEIFNEIPEIDAVLGTGTFGKINGVIDAVLEGKRINNIGSPAFNYDSSLPRILTQKHYAYVKIAEGCNNNCSYCSIPKIRGPYYSRPMEDIQDEVKILTDSGVKEIIIIAQDITRYGEDIYGKRVLVKLLERLLENNDIKWLRLMYAYPESITDELLELMAKEDRICNYLDIPIQHSSDRIRKLMNRRGSREDLLLLIKKVRSYIPDIVLRTSLIVGFPGESTEDFQDLLNFVQEVSFGRLGVFKYSAEEGTAAYNIRPQIPDKIKIERQAKIMEFQQKISYNNNQSMLNKELEVIVDEITDAAILARTKYDAPDIDNQVYLPFSNLRIGDIRSCIIKQAYEYDLIGELKNEYIKD
ncbi:MAG: 30S ribosomal protein S12 methylthiotransferase RimO [Halanaerobiaceae bacterium]|jgi:ribosomal protein S12 methylthiotransferase|nr:30S ribosomal protein S12 methylthiotransferase RimO [Halanaerobiaceae bacterium]